MAKGFDPFVDEAGCDCEGRLADAVGAAAACVSDDIRYPRLLVLR